MCVPVYVCMHVCIYMRACVPMIMSVIPWCLCERVCLFSAGVKLCLLCMLCSLRSGDLCLGGGGAGERAGGRPGAKERGHIHIHRIGHAHVNHF